MNNDNYLAHEGVKGQKWGIRRYQNPDGSLTTEGRRHYGYGDGTRQALRAQIRMTREKARAERKLAKVEGEERIKDAKQKQKLNAKLNQIKNADRLKEDRQKEKQLVKDIKTQKRQIAEFKAKHPLQYQKMKKYLKSDGTLNDEGQMLFFGNGKKKNLTNMSNQDLKNAAYRMQLKNKYNEQVANYTNHDPKANAKRAVGKVLGTGAIVFASSLAFKSAADALSNGKESVDMRENGKAAAAAAISAMGIQITRTLDLQSNKGNAAYNALDPSEKNRGNKDSKNNDNNSKKSNSNTSYTNNSKKSNSNTSSINSSKKSSQDWVNRTANRNTQRQINVVKAKAKSNRDFKNYQLERQRVDNMVRQIANKRSMNSAFNASNITTNYQTQYNRGVQASRNLGINMSMPYSQLPDLDLSQIRRN